jgi:UDP-N-acetylglucosamine 1-carboxyvinyltransferase
LLGLSEANKDAVNIGNTAFLAPSTLTSLSDVETINNVLTTLNADVTYKKDENAVVVDATKTLNELPIAQPPGNATIACPSLAKRGPITKILARILLTYSYAIGSRPIEQHIKGFEALGAEIHLENGNIYANAKDGLFFSCIFN